MKTQKDHYEVLVVGGGVAGCAAAVSAARAGKRTALFERAVTLGGLATNGLINFFEPLCDGTGRQVTFGIAEEMLLRFVALGGNRIPACWREGTEEERRAASVLPKAEGRYVSAFTPALSALSLLRFLTEEGVEVVFDALLTDVFTEGGRATELQFATQSGAERFSADVVIDATGSAEVFFRGGFPTAEGGNVLTYMAHVCGAEPYARKWKMLGNPTPWSDASGERIAGTSRAAVNRMVREGQLALYEKLERGEICEDVVALPAMPQFRTIRRIAGAYTLTGEDANRRFGDSLGVCGHFMQRGVWYEIPYRALVGTAENVVSAGRIISADGEAWNATRVIPAAALTGELAGLVAARAIDCGSAVYALDAAKLQEDCLARGLLLHG